MRAVNVYFEDDDFNQMNKIKGDMSWRDFFIKCAIIYRKHKGDGANGIQSA